MGLSLILTRAGLGARLAEAGRQFTRETYSWSVIEQKYQALLAMVAIGKSVAKGEDNGEA